MRVLTLGTFDTPHMGHAVFLGRCRLIAAGAPVLVGVNTDRFVAAYKGNPPLFSLDERRALIEELGFETVANDGPGRRAIREWVRAGGSGILAVGEDWAARDYAAQINVTADELDEWGVVLVYVGYRSIVSTTTIVTRAKERR